MKLSIIVPAYNVEKYIIQTLNSVYSDGYIEDTELIVVNDGSTDNTYELLLDYKLDKVGYNIQIVTKENGGVSSARNFGLDIAKGEFVYFLDGDDFLSSQAVSDLISLIENSSNIDAIVWGYDTINESNERVEEFKKKYYLQHKYVDGLSLLDDIVVNHKFWIWTGSICYKRSKLESNHLKFTVGCTNGEDQEFLLKFLSIAQNVLILDKILSFYLIRKGSITNSFNIKKFDSIEALIRVISYLKKSISIPISIIDAIEKDMVISSFKYNMILSLLNSKVSFKEIQILENQIDSHYPTLRMYVIDCWRDKNKSFFEWLEYRLYKKSSSLYFYILVIYSKSKSYSTK